MKLKWLTNKRRGKEFETVYQTVTGEPQATDRYTAAQLQVMGYVGGIC